MKKVLSCIMSIVPMIFVFAGTMIISIASFVGNNVDIDTGLVMMIIGFVLMVLYLLLCWVDIAWFMYMMVKNPKIDSQMKIIWGILLVVLNIYTFPVYWFIYIRKE